LPAFSNPRSPGDGAFVLRRRFWALCPRCYQAKSERGFLKRQHAAKIDWQELHLGANAPHGSLLVLVNKTKGGLSSCTWADPAYQSARPAPGRHDILRRRGIPAVKAQRLR